MKTIAADNVRGMNSWVKLSLITLFTALSSIFIYNGWYMPLLTGSATSTYYFNTDGPHVHLGIDGDDDYHDRHRDEDEYRGTSRIQMTSAIAYQHRSIEAEEDNCRQKLLSAYGPVYATGQILSAPSVTIGTSDEEGTSGKIYWRADIYDHNPNGQQGNSELLWSSTGSDEGHTRNPVALTLNFSNTVPKFIVAGHRLKVVISSRAVSTNSEPVLSWGYGTAFSSMTVTETAPGANTVTVSGLEDYSRGTRTSVLQGSQGVAMLKFDLVANATTNWTGGKLDKIGSNPNPGDVTFDIYMDSNTNGVFDVSADLRVGGPYSFSQATAGGYTLTTPQALSGSPQRYFIIYNVSATATPLTTVGGRVVDGSYFTFSGGQTVNPFPSTSSSLPVINGGGVPYTRTYPADWNTGTLLVRPENGGPTVTNTVSSSSTITEPVGAHLVGLLNFPSHTGTASGYHVASEANSDFVRLYFNGSNGYASSMAQVKGISFRFRARSYSQTATFTSTLFYVKPDGTRITSPVSSRFSTSYSQTKTLSLAGQTFTNVPAGSRLGVQIGVDRAGAGVALGSTVGAQLVVEETPSEAVAGIDIGDGNPVFNQLVLAGRKDRPVNSFTLSVPTGSTTVNSVTITGGPTTNGTNVSSVKLYHDQGIIGELDSADILLGSTATYNSSSATITGMAETLGATAKNYLVTYDISATPTIYDLLTGLVTAIGSSAQVNSNNDISSGILKIMPTTTVTNDTTEPPNSILPRSGPPANLDSFGIKTNGGVSDTINSVTVTLAPAGVSARVAQVEIVDKVSGTVYGSLSATTSGDKWQISTSGLVAAPAAKECSVRIRPRDNIFTVYTVTGTVSAITHLQSQNGLVFADIGSATITLDGKPPTDPVLSAGTGSAAGQIQLSWTTASDDIGLNPTIPYRVLRGDPNGPPPVNCLTGTQVYEGNQLTITDSGLQPAKSYSYRVCATDLVNNRSGGSTAVAMAQMATNCTATPTISFVPPGLTVLPGGQATYTVVVTNNDTGSCVPATFNLALNGTENSISFVTPSVLLPPAVTMPANGGSAVVSLKVTAKPNAGLGAFDTFSVRVTDSLNQHPSIESIPISTVVNTGGGMIHNSANTDARYGVWGLNYTCSTCHSKGDSLNIKGIATNIATQTGIRPVTFTTVSAPVNVTAGVFGNDRRSSGRTSANVCEVCHHRTRYHQYSSSKLAMLDHYNSHDCMACHPHRKGFKYSSGGDCTGCHGNPPTSVETLAYPPTNALGLVDGTAGAHATHMNFMNCDACHTGSTPDHMGNYLLKVGFTINAANFTGFNSGVTISSGAISVPTLNNLYQWQTSPGTTRTEGANAVTCSVYCHGWPGGGGIDQNPFWSGSDQSRCDNCHNAIGDTPPNSGSHAKHSGTIGLNNGISCETCHGTIAKPGHINGKVEWDLSRIVNNYSSRSPFSSGATYKGVAKGNTGAPAPSNPAGFGSCSNFYCHSNVQSANGTAGPTRYAQPQWNGATLCGSCHDDMAISSSATGGHTQHAGDPVTQFECRMCHSSGGDANPWNHADGRIDISFVGLGANTVYSRGSHLPASGPYGTCSNGNCHARQTIAWQGSSTLPLCEKCHGYQNKAFYSTAGFGTTTSHLNPQVGAHTVHSVKAPNNYSSPMECSNCHIEPAGPYSPGHIDTPLPVELHFDMIATAGAFIGYTTTASYNFGTRTCVNIWCHGGGMNSNTGRGDYAGLTTDGGTPYTPAVPVWNAPYLNGTASHDCTWCHGYPPPAPSPSYAHFGKGPADCNDCHNNVNLAGTGFLDATIHIDGTVQGGCSVCHGSPPVDMKGLCFPNINALRGGNAGAHNAHLLNPNILNDCNVCHAGYIRQMASNTLEMGFNAYGGKVTGGVYYGYSTLTNNVYVSRSAGTVVKRTNNLALVNRCSSVYCHGGGTATKTPLGGRTITSPSWELGYDEVACGTCHGVTAASYAATGSHGRHAGTAAGGVGLACEGCHGLKENNYHVNGSVEWYLNSSDVRIGAAARYKNMSSGGTGDLAPSATFGSCANIYCHSNVQATGGLGSPTFYGTPLWGSTAPLGCGACHKNMGNDPAATGSHAKHTYPCYTCHSDAGSGTAKHADHIIDISFSGLGAGTVYSTGSHAAGSKSYGSCSNIPCHGNQSADWGGTVSNPTFSCTACHGMQKGARDGVASQFTANSHHIQGVAITSAHCYQCHWEANSDGTINSTYHQKTAGAPVNLVVYGAGGRPTSYSAGTFIVYTASGSRKQQAKLNIHCLACHNDQNSTAQPFGDGKTPKQYAWDAASIGTKFSDTGTTPWGKYVGTNVSPKNARTKAFSAHGNATANQGGWDTSETWPNTRAGSMNVYCFDCHNSHGSDVSGKTTSYTSATVNGGILKDTSAGKGGYAMTYKPATGGATASHNAYNPGAGLCFDCHLTQTAGTTPWGASSTFGATQKIQGYMDTDYFGLGTSGYESRFPFKSMANKGGHFGAYSTMSVPPDAGHQIGGLCTPCHDPHGVSTTLGTNRQFAVPMLKGTWLTSPYKEDVPPVDNQAYMGRTEDPGPLPLASYNAAITSWRIDQNTFASGTITQTEAQFAGLCLNCHQKNSLTNGTNHTWASKDRVHESVKGWKTNGTAVKHSYSCSKCHAPHNANLPRLMITDCLDARHRSRVSNNTSPVTSGSYSDESTGSGRMPGVYSYSGKKSGSSASNLRSCHEGNDTTQKWNTKTRW